jgi:hypothetical protein
LTLVESTFDLFLVRRKMRFSNSTVIPLILLLQADCPLSDVTARADYPHFRLLLHGSFGGSIENLDISSESQTLEAGSTIIAGLDRLMKLFWISGVDSAALTLMEALAH